MSAKRFDLRAAAILEEVLDDPLPLVGEQRQYRRVGTRYWVDGEEVDQATYETAYAAAIASLNERDSE